VLLEVTQRAREAETTKNEVLLAKDRAQRLVDVIAADKGVAEMKLEAARPALEEAESALNTIKPAHIGMYLLNASSQFSTRLSVGSSTFRYGICYITQLFVTGHSICFY